MRIVANTLLSAALVMVSIASWSQEVERWGDPDILARLSYDNGEAGRTCLSVSPAGGYRIVRTSDMGQIQRVQGTIPAEQFQQLKKLLFSTQFRALSGNHGGLIREQAESFAAELPAPGWQRGDKTQRLQWLNGDGENPFPPAVATVIDWLKDFHPKNGKPFEYVELQDVCPSVGLSFVQPSVAINSHP